MLENYRLKLCILLIAVTCVLTTWCAFLYLNNHHISILLFSLVCLGTGYDFWGTVSGKYVRHEKTLLFLARTRYFLVNFGILFTPYTLLFILSESQSQKILFSYWFANHYFCFLLLSLFTGVPYLVSRYTTVKGNYYPVVVVDKTSQITQTAFILRRMMLLLSLVLALLAAIDGFLIETHLFAGVFIVLFIVCVPLHILKKNSLAMLVEVATLCIVFLGVNIYFT